MTLAAAPRRRREKKFIIGPEHDGQKMSLKDFDQWPVKAGYIYELGRGIIQVSNVPLPSHGAQIQEVRNQCVLYQLQNPGVINYMSGGSDAKLLIGSLESERHPDWVIYKTPYPEDTRKAWRLWIPEIVIEVVSKSSGPRDYGEKPDEYFDFGVKEYWIIDAFKGQMLARRRSGGEWDEKIIRPGTKYSTALLPKFNFDLKKVIAPAKA